MSFAAHQEDSSATEKKGNEIAEIKLKREIGLLGGVSIIIGSIIGCGIFVSPKGVLLFTGSVGMSIVVWIAAGLLSLTGAMCYAELGTSIPGSGGTYLYLNCAFGPVMAFLYLYTAILIAAPCTAAILALTFANYVTQAFFPIGCELPETALRLMAAATLTFLTFMNCYDVRGTVRAQAIFLYTKVSALVLVILCGVVHLLRGNTKNFARPFENTIMDPGSISLAFYSGFFSYNGYMTLNFLTEELQEPMKNLPRSIYISVPIVTLVYTLANMAYFAVIEPSQILVSNAVALTFAEKMFGSWNWMMPLLVAISTLGSLAINILQNSRLVFSAAREGHCPSFLSYIQIWCYSPTPALVFMCIASLIYLTISDIFVLINYSLYAHSLANLGVVTGLIYMRKRDKDLERPLKVSMVYPVVYFITSLFAVILPVYVRPVEVSLAIVITLTGLPVYYCFIATQISNEWFHYFYGKLSCLCQKLFVAVPED